MAGEQNEKIISLLKEKVLLKEEVFGKTKSVFARIKNILTELSVELLPEIRKINNSIVVECNETNEFEIQFTLADEVLLFVMHSNIFTFDSSHEVWKSPYIQKDHNRAFCGKIFIYNFLSDSFKYHRTNDVGYMIARIFVNREDHYFIEGEKQISNLYNDFSTTELTDENLKKIIESAILYSLDFDPFTPPYERSAVISISEIIDASLQSRIATGKRLGFKFQTDSDFKL